MLGMVVLLLVTMALLLPATRQEPLSPRAISEIKFALQEEYRTRVTQFLEVCQYARVGGIGGHGQQ